MKTEQNKIDNQFRRKLEQREIQPSAQSWDRLDAMLAVAEPKRKNRYARIYMAASFIGFILMATVFFRQDQKLDSPETKAVVVDQNVSQPAPTDATPINTISVQEDIAAVNPRRKSSSSRTKKPEINPLSQEPKTQILPIQTEFPSSINVQDIIADATKSAIQNQSSKRVSVDPKQLLSQVDGEINTTFREKMLNTIGRNYNEVKVALETRNQQ